MTGLTAEQIALLAKPLSGAHVRQRQQAGRTFSYLEAWHIIAEANRIFGFDGWNREMMDCRCVAERETKIGQAERQRDGWRIGYVARVRVTVGNVVREGCGYGSGIDVDLGTAHESALKEAESDAMKRALMTFGNQFGLALYDKAQSNVEAPARPAAPPAPPLERRGPHSTTAAPTRNATSYIHDAPPPDHQGRTVNSIRDEAQAALVDAKSIARVNEIKAMYKDTLAEIDKIKPAVSNNIRILAETRIKELAADEYRAKELTNPRMPEEDQFTDHRI